MFDEGTLDPVVFYRERISHLSGDGDPKSGLGSSGGDGWVRGRDGESSLTERAKAVAEAWGRGEGEGGKRGETEGEGYLGRDMRGFSRRYTTDALSSKVEVDAQLDAAGEASRWWRRAAVEGCASAQLALGQQQLAAASDRRGGAPHASAAAAAAAAGARALLALAADQGGADALLAHGEAVRDIALERLTRNGSASTGSEMANGELLLDSDRQLSPTKPIGVGGGDTSAAAVAARGELARSVWRPPRVPCPAPAFSSSFSSSSYCLPVVYPPTCALPLGLAPPNVSCFFPAYTSKS